MTARESAHTLLRAFLGRPRDARLGLYTGEALHREGHIEAAVAVWTLADEVDPRIRQLKDAPDAPDDARAASACADTAIREHLSELHRRSIDRLAASTGADLDRVRRAVWPLTHHGRFEFCTPLQQPVVFYMPDLPALPVTPTDRLPWVGELETMWPGIRAEYERAVERRIAMRPYVPASTRDSRWTALRGRLDWSAIHLYKDAQRTTHTPDFPVTLAALEEVDLVRVDDTPMEVFFSRLTPGAHIPPHFGLTNTRLTVHLPLIVPENCEIRVGSETHRWREGEIVAFDDSFEHEAWNRAASDRVVLIFESHHPDLSAPERVAIEHAYGARQQWLQDRRNLLETLLS